MEKELVIFPAHFGFGAVYKLFYLPQNPDQSCFEPCAKNGLGEARKLASLKLNHAPPHPHTHTLSTILHVQS